MSQATGPYDHLLDAEREAMARLDERSVRPDRIKIPLIKALREASAELSLRDAKHAVEEYLARRAGQVVVPSDRPIDWIDDLLDAERAAASREDRRVTKILLIKALRDASPGLGLARAKGAVEDYLRRRGGEDLPTGSSGWIFLAALITLLVAGAILGFWLGLIAK